MLTDCFRNLIFVFGVPMVRLFVLCLFLFKCVRQIPFLKYCGERILMNRNGIKNFDTLEVAMSDVACAAHFLPAVD